MSDNKGKKCPTGYHAEIQNQKVACVQDQVSSNYLYAGGAILTGIAVAGTIYLNCFRTKLVGVTDSLGSNVDDHGHDD